MHGDRGGPVSQPGVKADGSIIAWGRNDSGQCEVPTPNSGFVAIAAGGWHSVGLRSDGSIAAWGDDSFGQCILPSPNEGFVSIAGGLYHSLAIKAACNKDLAGDIVLDCMVDSEDLAAFVQQWMNAGCIEPGWCAGADLTRDRRVGIEDLAVMAEEWMK